MTSGCTHMESVAICIYIRSDPCPHVSLFVWDVDVYVHRIRVSVPAQFYTCCA